MRVEAASVLSPLIGAVVVWGISYVLAAGVLEPVVVAATLTLGFPVAIVLAALTSIYLRHRLLAPTWSSFIWCSVWGAFLATVACAILVGFNSIAVPLIAWGFFSGFLYRWLSGDKVAMATGR